MRAGFLAAVLLLAACAGAPPPSPSLTPTEPVRILETGLSGFADEPFSVAAATNQADYEALWQAFSLKSLPPAVDFDTELAIYLGMAGSSSCPEVFQQLVIEDDVPRVYATWQSRPPNQPCTDDLASQGFLLAVSRAVLPDEPFTLQLREQLVCRDCPEHSDRALIDPTSN